MHMTETFPLMNGSLQDAQVTLKERQMEAWIDRYRSYVAKWESAKDVAALKGSDVLGEVNGVMRANVWK